MSIPRKSAFFAGAALAFLVVVAIGYASAQNASNNSTTDGGGILPGASGGHGHAANDPNCPLHGHPQQPGATSTGSSSSGDASTASASSAA